MADVLKICKDALRVKASAYDDEIQIYIDSVKDELARLDITFVDTDADFIHACVNYVKGNFGNAAPAEKEIWMQMYQRSIDKLRLKNLGDG